MESAGNLQSRLMALAPLVLVLNKSFILWFSVGEAVFDYEYQNNLIILCLSIQKSINF